jgi:(p)ppGpp synthase/HD superfamily hydrolase
MEERAIRLATRLHEGQTRKDGSPYILHPLRVMSAFNDLPGYEGLIMRAAAVLHDVVEDCDITVGSIIANFGGDVGAIVDRLTRRTGERYSDYIERCAALNLSRRIKIADVRDNFRNVDDLPDAKEAKSLRKRYEETLAILLSYPA